MITEKQLKRKATANRYKAFFFALLFHGLLIGAIMYGNELSTWMTDQYQQIFKDKTEQDPADIAGI